MTTKEMIEVMQAYERGEQIEYRIKDFMRDDEWYVQKSIPEWDWRTYDYRVKPKPTYKQYKNADEFLAAQKEHGMWLASQRVSGYFMPVKIISQNVEICATNTQDFYVPREISFKELLNNYIWQDGTPCGIKE